MIDQTGSAANRLIVLKLKQRSGGGGLTLSPVYTATRPRLLKNQLHRLHWPLALQSISLRRTRWEMQSGVRSLDNGRPVATPARSSATDPTWPNRDGFVPIRSARLFAFNKPCTGPGRATNRIRTGAPAVPAPCIPPSFPHPASSFLLPPWR